MGDKAINKEELVGLTLEEVIEKYENRFKELVQKGKEQEVTIEKLLYENKELLRSSAAVNYLIELLTKKYNTIGDIFGDITDRIVKDMDAEGAAIYLIENGELVVKVSNGIPQSDIKTKLSRDNEEHKKFWDVIDKGERYIEKVSDKESNVLHPIEIYGKIIGFFRVDRAKNGIGYTSGNSIGLDNITSLLAVAIDYHSQILDFVTSLATTLEAKDKYTKGHSDRVTKYAKQITRELCGTGSKGSEIEAALDIAGVLHDIGKEGIPDIILNKPDKLTDEEFEEVKKHPEKGVEIVTPALRRTQYAEFGIQLILYHQERYDGKGYPKGLKGEGIPLIARILAVADAFDAMTSERPYRKGMPIEKAIGIINGEKSNQFDPEVVDAFLKIYKERQQDITNIMKPSY
ncbi:HD domain-containing protein [Candidatus Woesearchaeota archaeon]|nr:HD domain-containing protein [Candidatus Woesearchaeota archaeon]